MNTLWRISALFLTALCLGAAALPMAALAQAPGPADDVYVVSGVAVDQTADSPSAARETALAQGHSRAFERLMQRIVPPRQRELIPAMSPADIAPMVLSFGIDTEKTSSVRYVGRLTFRFKRDEIRRFLQNGGIAFAETRSKPVLLLPVFGDGAVKRLWTEPNPWFDAWMATPPSDGLVPLQLPAGDLADVQDISVLQASNGDTEAVARIAERYGVGTVIVSEAIAGVGSSGQTALNITSRYFGGPFDGQTRVRTVGIGPEDTLEQAVNAAALDIQAQIEEAWQRGNQLDFGRLNELVAVVSLADLRDWVEIRQRLKSIAFLEGQQLLAVTRERVAVRLSYYGDADQLQTALAQKDLSLERSDTSWILRRSGAASGASAAPADTGAAPQATTLPPPVPAQ